MTRRRLTLRTQLTLLYAVPFTVTGTVLVTVSLLAGRESVPAGPGLPPQPTPAGDSFPLGPWSVLMAVLALVSLILGRLVAGRFLRPVRVITATARDISASDLHRRLGDIGGSDEFAELAATLDALFHRLETAFTAQRQFIANASHELRTPLTAERALLQVALADPDVTAASLQEACHEVLRLGAAQERLLQALFTLASGEQGIESRRPCDLADLTRAALQARLPDGISDPARAAQLPDDTVDLTHAALQAELPDNIADPTRATPLPDNIADPTRAAQQAPLPHNIARPAAATRSAGPSRAGQDLTASTVETGPQLKPLTVDIRLSPAPLTADPRLMESLIANLIDNAVRHNVPGGRVEVETTAVTGVARLVIRNSGPVVPPADTSMT